MPNYVSLTESQRRKIAVFITESQQLAQQTQLQQQLQQQQQQQQQQLQYQQAADGDDSIISSTPFPSSPVNLVPTPIVGNNAISCKEIVQFCQTRFGLTISLSTASRLRSSATERLSTDLLNPSAKRHRSVKFPEFEKALVQELRALEQEQLQIQQEQERLNREGPSTALPGGTDATTQIPSVMMLTSEAAITQVAKGIAERMGITESELGLTSGWYHGFRKRHGIKHRQLKQRSAASNTNTNTSTNSGMSSSPSMVDSTSSPGVSTSNAEGGDNGSEAGDGDEEMEDAQDAEGNKPADGTAGEVDSNPGTPLSFLKDQLIIANPASASSPLLNPRKPEVKKVTASSSNDALDVISEYLLQNGEIGATKLPLVKELRSFLMSQTNIENGALNNNSNNNNNAASSLNPNTNPNTITTAPTSASTSSSANSNSNSNGNEGNNIITSDTTANSLLLGNLPILAPDMGANDPRSLIVNSSIAPSSLGIPSLNAPVLVNIAASSSSSGTMVPMDNIAIIQQEKQEEPR
ncbi:hypothetical protein BGZ93_010810 [Podila epicladia]|nr:hypothetical protein BGZ92_009645 [Podila epicladia]KAG0087662.1 hypothetical protein BGZ93_010810 [Podila epicladia]